MISARQRTMWRCVQTWKNIDLDISQKLQPIKKTNFIFAFSDPDLPTTRSYEQKILLASCLPFVTLQNSSVHWI